MHITFEPEEIAALAEALRSRLAEPAGTLRQLPELPEEWRDQLHVLEEHFGGMAEFRRRLHDIPARTYSAWKRGERTPPEWMQQVILDFLKRES